MIAPYLSLSSAGLERFFEPRHQQLVARLEPIVAALRSTSHDAAAVAAALGAEHGLYGFVVPQALGGEPADQPSDVDIRALVLVREALGYAHPQADAIFAVQGLGCYPIALAGNAEQRALLAEALTGARIGAFALTEPEAGSDVASLRCEARRDGEGWVLEGDKTLISNVPIAHHYVVFARIVDAGLEGKRAISAFLVEQGAPGLELVVQPMSSDHPIGELHLRGCRGALLGDPGAGLRIALGTLETFRISVGAAANGMASAALEDALDHVRRRRQFGKPLADQQLVQAMLAEMATELDAARLLVARAAWLKDCRGGRAGAEVAMAKMQATESAQRIIDRAVQLHGGRGVLLGSRVEALYRDIRPLRIYEGTTEIQKLLIARALLERSSG